MYNLSRFLGKRNMMSKEEIASLDNLLSFLVVAGIIWFVVKSLIDNNEKNKEQKAEQEKLRQEQERLNTKHLIFPNYTFSDENIEISYKNKKMFVSNNTQEYIDIKSVSIYYGSYVEANVLNSTNEAEAISEVAPESTQEIPLSFKGKKIEEEAGHIYKNLIDEKYTKSTNFNFGLSLKYKTGNRTQDITLYKKDNFNLYKVLEEIDFK
jgi:hypothetical protein